ncbi:FAD-binding and (Fe-S)-binding domain-containing protein [Zooshikella harenae]|uniref:D-lactate dehydrogenase (cytochrome) n=1 Tax=Zooshikella harenae TaxID=2827238 RepID=A0ABS5ZH09_9GAMM|nr:FAD-binding and (Fe-S)-binding domain-containing protein [Zooshikella harenae]MBU2713158.1 FAD-binding oxidoreductase [Zooshikella harenae]
MNNWNVFTQQLASIFSKEQLITDEVLHYAYSTDASCYRLLPKLIVHVNHEHEISQLLQLANQYQVGITFRAAGTSLSGQAITDSVLVVLGPDWNNYRIEQEGTVIQVQPGVIGAHVNRLLQPWQRKLGPDPASINSCKIGGIVANNASGMCCGVAANSYHTLRHMRLMLADGTILDTADNNSIKAFKQHHQPLLDKLQQLSQQTHADASLSKRIRHKYRLKNTTGYAINALIDFTDPIEILIHLLVGSEGTLGFISSVTLNTIKDYPYKAATLVVFPTLVDACQAVETLQTMPVAAVELMDSRSLHAVATHSAMPGTQSLSPQSAAILIETQTDSEAQLNQSIKIIEQCLSHFQPLTPARFTTDKDNIDQLWAIRKGLFPAVGAQRKPGSTVIIEDVAFPIEHLAAGVQYIQHLFTKFGYSDGIIFGHALAGNVHFVFSQRFDNAQHTQQYQQFMEEVCKGVALQFGGSLKAEHGTGRNIAPFVELEWGSTAYQLMKTIKQIFDPNHILNPGVLLNDNPHVHLENFKIMSSSHPLIDTCIECGFCEAVCPSKNLSFTPRQRIAVWREITRRQQHKEPVKHWLQQFHYYGNQTCAATGLCANRCPVNINTGEFIRSLRQQQAKHARLAQWTANHFDLCLTGIKMGLKLAEWSGQWVGRVRQYHLSQTLHNLSGKRLPLWPSTLPLVVTQQCLKKYPRSSTQKGITPKKFDPSKTIVYWPSCVTKVISGTKSLPPLTMLIPDILMQLGFNVLTVDEKALCCGQPYLSKGYKTIAEQKRQQLHDTLFLYSNNGKWPILADTSPCLLQTKNSSHLTLYEPFNFCLKYIVNSNKGYLLTPIKEQIALHITCSTHRMGLTLQAQQLAEHCAQKVIIPPDISCCGFAGDKGFNFPELNASALATLKSQVANCSRGFSTSITCETGLSLHSGIPYQSIFYLVAEALGINTRTDANKNIVEEGK